MDTFEVCTEIDKCLHRLEFSDNNNLAVGISRLHIQAMSLHQNIFCFDRTQNIYSYLNTFMIRSDFPQRNAFNNVLKGIASSGLTSKWQKDIRIYRQLSKHHSEVHSINIMDFYFAFLFASVFLNLSITAIILEFIVYYKFNSPNSKHYWTFWDKLISGIRYFVLLEPNNDDVIIPFTN